MVWNRHGHTLVSVMRRRGCATVLVGQCSLFREGLSHILCSADSRFRIVASIASVRDVSWEPTEPGQATLLIVDSNGDPRAMTGEIEVFKRQRPDGRVAVLADQYVFPWVLSAFRSGANAYLLKALTSDAFIKALELVMLGETILPSELLAFMDNPAQPAEDRGSTMHLDVRSDMVLQPDAPELPKLSYREEYILRYIGEGYPNKLIARKMGIAEGTVKVHVKAILRKIRVGNRTQAAIWLMNNSTAVRDIASLDPPALPGEAKTFAAIDAVG